MFWPTNFFKIARRRSTTLLIEIAIDRRPATMTGPRGLQAPAKFVPGDLSMMAASRSTAGAGGRG